MIASLANISLLTWTASVIKPTDWFLAAHVMFWLASVKQLDKETNQIILGVLSQGLLSYCTHVQIGPPRVSVCSESEVIFNITPANFILCKLGGYR